jgi:hypothetical protein
MTGLSGRRIETAVQSQEPVEGESDDQIQAQQDIGVRIYQTYHVERGSGANGTDRSAMLACCTGRGPAMGHGGLYPAAANDSFGSNWAYRLDQADDRVGR